MEKTETTQQPDPMETEADAPSLDLSEVLQRPVIKGPDSKPYELRTMEEFSVEDEHLLRSELDIFSELMSKRVLKGDDKLNLRLRLDNTFDKIIIAGDPEKKLFNDKQRQKVLMFFRTRCAREDAEIIRGAIQEIQAEEEGTEASTSTMES